MFSVSEVPPTTEAVIKLLMYNFAEIDYYIKDPMQLLWSTEFAHWFNIF